MALFRTRNSSDSRSEPANRKKSASVDTVETLRTREAAADWLSPFAYSWHHHIHIAI